MRNLVTCFVLATALLGWSCDSSDGEADTTSSTSGHGGGAGDGGDGGGGGGTGGSGGDPCGGCQEPTPMCDTDSNTCVACLGHDDCTSATAARCEGGSCVPCQGSAECSGVAEGEVCEAGTCVECALSDESACTASQTCDLVQLTCVDVTAGSIGNCEACTNDAQCTDGRCIPMDFEESPHGYYCLTEPSPMCDQPFSVTINRPSLNGAAATNYCGIVEDLATCEAVLALLGSWYCTGTDGMCSELAGGPEVAVPGSVCRQVGFVGDRCTYECSTGFECPSLGPPSSCGDGDSSPPGWCGG